MMLLSQNFCVYFTIFMFNFNFLKNNIACNSGRVGLARLKVYTGRVMKFQPALESGRVELTRFYCGLGRVGPFKAV